jgi:hypothetical protein
MTVAEIFGAARESYVSAFVEALSDHGPSHVEAALRDKAGALVRDGSPASPVRVDLIVKASGDQITVSGTSPGDQSAWAGSTHGLQFVVSPFRWEQAELQFEGIIVDGANRVSSWFMRWFDPDDSNSADSDGLYGVVHYLSDIATEANVLRFTVDFGSVSQRAVEDLLEVMVQAGAVRGSVT